MSGTRAGGLKTAAKIKRLHGEDFYKKIGHKGGQNGTTGGFAANPILAKSAGAKGGLKSRRGPSEKTVRTLQEHSEEIKKLACAGMYYGQIAKMYGLNRATLLKWLDKNL